MVVARLAFGGAALFGLAFVGIGIAMMTRQARFERTALLAEGVVVGLRRHVNRGPSTEISNAYYATVRFVTAFGQPVEAESRFASNPVPGRVGQTVTVRYDPNDPQHFTTTRIERTAGCVAIGMIVMGGIFFAIFAMVAISL